MSAPMAGTWDVRIVSGSKACPTAFRRLTTFRISAQSAVEAGHGDALAVVATTQSPDLLYFEAGDGESRSAGALVACSPESMLAFDGLPFDMKTCHSTAVLRRRDIWVGEAPTFSEVRDISDPNDLNAISAIPLAGIFGLLDSAIAPEQERALIEAISASVGGDNRTIWVQVTMSPLYGFCRSPDFALELALRRTRALIALLEHHGSAGRYEAMRPAIAGLDEPGTEVRLFVVGDSTP